MKKLIVLILVLSIPSAIYAQENKDKTITSISNSYSLSDTTKVNLNSSTLNIDWMGTTVEVRFLTSLIYDLEHIRKFNKDSFFSPSEETKKGYLEMMKIASQNCHSYALEKYFDYHNIEDSILFTDKSVLVENKYMKSILATAFKKTKSVNTKPKKNFKTEFTEGSLLVFRNKDNWAIHTVFYDGKYQSKNGIKRAKSYDKLIDIYKTYWDTVIIEEYQLDTSKVGLYLTQREG